jgi:hypothetical protein
MPRPLEVITIGERPVRLHWGENVVFRAGSSSRSAASTSFSVLGAALPPTFGTGRRITGHLVTVLGEGRSTSTAARRRTSRR